MVTLHQMAEASFGQAGASATSFVYLGAVTATLLRESLHRGILQTLAVWQACMRHHEAPPALYPL